MKRLNITFLLTLLISLISIKSNAYDFAVDGIYYNVVSIEDLTCEIAPQYSKSSSYSGDFVIPNNVQYNGKTLKVVRIGNYAFAESSITSVTIPNGITRIGEYAFYKCTKVTFVSIPSTVISLGNRSFQFCNQLESVSLPNSVNTIGIYLFSNCVSLRQITIPNGVTSIPQYTFSNCTSLVNVSIPQGVNTIGEHAFDNCTSLVNVSISQSVNTIGEYAFSGCTAMHTLTIPSSCKKIENYAFNDCIIRKLVLEDSSDILKLGVSYWRYYNGTNGSDYHYFYRDLFSHSEIDTLYWGRPIALKTSKSENLSRDGYARGVFGNQIKKIIVGNQITDDNINEGYSKSLFYYTRNELSQNLYLTSKYHNVTFGKRISSIPDLSYNEQLDSIFLLNEIPPTAKGFSNKTYMNCTLCVPQGSRTTYESAPIWKNFWNIIESDQDPVLATGISLNQTTLSFNAANQTATLKATITPSNATNKNVTWTSSNTSVATVSDTGVVTSKANGTAVITATTTDGTNLTATCNVTVTIDDNSLTTTTINGITYYLIKNAADFMAFASLVNNGDYGANAILIADINLSNVSNTWIPIGNADNPFTGIFDGQEHAITGFEYTAISDCNGLFGVINNATVKNLSISGTLTSQKDWNGVVGRADGASVVSGIHSSLTLNVSNCAAHTGGVVGGSFNVQGRNHTVLVEGCEYSGILRHSGEGDCQAGVIGYTYSGGVRNCIFSGTIIGEKSKYGGILGYCKNIDFIGVQNCLSVGKIVTDADCITAAAIIGKWNGKATAKVKNNYYCLQEGSTTTIAIGNNASNCEAPHVVTTEQLASGEICYALNDDQSEIHWYQTLGVDAHPVLNKNHGIVLYDSSTGIYSNRDEDGISAIKLDNALDNVIYNLSGQRIPTIQKGINIIRMSDGTSKKVLIK